MSENGIDRPDGFLTATDREYLEGNRDFSSAEDPEAAERQQRYRVKQRARGAVYDFQLLFHGLAFDDTRDLFQDMFHPDTVEASEELGAWKDLFMFYWVGFGFYSDRAYDPIEEGIAHSVFLQHILTENEVPDLDVSLDISIEDTDPVEKTIEDLRDGRHRDDEVVTEVLLEALYMTGKLDPEEVEQLAIEFCEQSE